MRHGAVCMEAVVAMESFLNLVAFASLALLVVLQTACGETARLTVADGTGAQPQWVAPNPTLMPTVNIAPARGWPADVKPQAAAGTRAVAFAVGLDHPRWLMVLPNGDVLVAETNAPPRPDDGNGLRGFVMGLVMKRAGAAGPSANRITLLRDSQGTGVADVRSVLLEGLNAPFGMSLIGTDLYVANTDAILRFPYSPGQTRITAPGIVLVKLSAGAINHHWTKNLIASADGRKLYVSVGSNSNAAERGMDVEAERAAIWEVDVSTGAHRVYASGLRNPNGMAWAPGGALWTVVNERDGLGSDLVPDYLTSVQEGGFYGWPYSYFGSHLDERVQPQRPELVAMARVPDYALGPHTASIGLAASLGAVLPARFANGMFISQHGSWNRRPHSGYRVIFVKFDGALPTEAPPLEVLTHFLDGEGNAYGRPVGVAVDRLGGLLVADDVGNVVWRVTATP
jgi:glucose/arabinose dehydrogenase